MKLPIIWLAGILLSGQLLATEPEKGFLENRETKYQVEKSNNFWVCVLETLHEKSFLISGLFNFIQYEYPSFSIYQLQSYIKQNNLSDWSHNDALRYLTLRDFLWKVPTLSLIEGLLIRYLSKQTLQKYYNS